MSVQKNGIGYFAALLLCCCHLGGGSATEDRASKMRRLEKQCDRDLLACSKFYAEMTTQEFAGRKTRLRQRCDAGDFYACDSIGQESQLPQARQKAREHAVAQGRRQQRAMVKAQTQGTTPAEKKVKISSLTEAEFRSTLKVSEQVCYSGRADVCKELVGFYVHGVNGIKIDIKRAAGFAVASCMFGDESMCELVGQLLGENYTSDVGIKLAAFKLIVPGIPHRAVAAIVGNPGELRSQTLLGGIRSSIYGWQNSDGSNAIVMFQNGRMVSKSQTGLK